MLLVWVLWSCISSILFANECTLAGKVLCKDPDAVLILAELLALPHFPWQRQKRLTPEKVFTHCLWSPHNSLCPWWEQVQRLPPGICWIINCFNIYCVFWQTQKCKIIQLAHLLPNSGCSRQPIGLNTRDLKKDLKKCKQHTPLNRTIPTVPQFVPNLGLVSLKTSRLFPEYGNLNVLAPNWWDEVQTGVSFSDAGCLGS